MLDKYPDYSKNEKWKILHRALCVPICVCTLQPFTRAFFLIVHKAKARFVSIKAEKYTHTPKKVIKKLGIQRVTFFMAQS